MKFPLHHLDGDIYLRETTENEWDEFFRAHVTQVFDRQVLFDFQALQTPEEKAKVEELKKAFAQVWKKHFFFVRENDILGWAKVTQTSPDTVYMENSGLLPAHRGQGIYSAYLRFLLPYLQKVGFQVVYSRHAATNNAILVPKLKQGFMLTHMELSARFGAMVYLTYHYSEDRRRMLHFRAGQQRIPPRIAEFIETHTDSED